MPIELIDNRSMTVTITLPARWMARYFIEWVGEAWKEQMLANEGQYLVVGTSPGNEFEVIFIRDNVHEEA